MSDPLREALVREGGLIAGALDAGQPAPDPVADAVAAGPRAAAAPGEYRLLVTAIREGEALHAGTARVVSRAEPDLALLAGDRLYALGLDRLAELGDLEAVADLADVISLSALALAEDRPDLAHAAWEAGAAAVGTGRAPGHREAVDAARRGAPDAPARLVQAANVARAQGETRPQDD